jgi:hypothetical protein
VAQAFIAAGIPKRTCSIQGQSGGPDFFSLSAIPANAHAMLFEGLRLKPHEVLPKWNYTISPNHPA